MLATDKLRDTRLPVNNGSLAIPALGFGTLIPDPVATRAATRAALEAGFRLLEVQHGRFPLPLWQLGSHHAGIAAAG